MTFSAPLRVGDGGFGLRYNNTLHGRSIPRCHDRPGHNVFKGWRTWATTGRCVGDALDCFAPSYTPVYVMHDGTQTRWSNDTSKLEVVYIENGPVCTVYAHINARFEGTGMSVTQGQQIGEIRWDLRDPHLHLEVWAEAERAVTAPTPDQLASSLMGLCQDTPTEQDVAPWAQYAVDWCKREGLMGGFPDGTFQGFAPVTRQQLALVLHRLAQRED